MAVLHVSNKIVLFFCLFVCCFFFLSCYKSPPPLILFILLFNIFITALLITRPFTTALSIVAVVVSALFICASSTVVLAFVEILDVLRKFFVLEDGFNSRNLAKLEKLYLIHCFRMKEKYWKESCRY